MTEIPAQFPTPLEWLRHLAAARECYADGRIASALRHMDLARRRAKVLDRPESGSCREAAYRAAVECIETYGVVLRPPAPPPVRPLPRGAVGVTSALARWPSWEVAFRTVAAARAALVSASDPRELDVFAEVFAAAFPTADLTQPSPAAPGRSVTGVVLRPERLEERGRADARDAAERHLEAGGRVVVLVGPGRPGDRSADRQRASWLQLCGTVTHLPTVLASPEGRIAAFTDRICRLLGPSAPVSEDASRLVAEYPWPGGFSEVESVASEVAALRPDRVDAEVLGRIGWERRVELARGRDLHPDEQAILRFLERSPWSASARVARGVGRPARTIVRALSRLVEGGRIVRRGVGRATRYAPLHSAAAGLPGPDAD